MDNPRDGHAFLVAVGIAGAPVVVPVQDDLDPHGLACDLSPDRDLADNVFEERSDLRLEGEDLTHISLPPRTRPLAKAAACLLENQEIRPGERNASRDARGH